MYLIMCILGVLVTNKHLKVKKAAQVDLVVVVTWEKLSEYRCRNRIYRDDSQHLFKASHLMSFQVTRIYDRKKLALVLRFLFLFSFSQREYTDYLDFNTQIILISVTRCRRVLVLRFKIFAVVNFNESKRKISRRFLEIKIIYDDNFRSEWDWMEFQYL